MPRGIVRWFNDVTGWGFIRQDGIAEDIFVNFRGIKTKVDGHRTLVPNEAVEYLIKKDVKGLRAVDVVRTTLPGPQDPASPKIEVSKAANFECESAVVVKTRCDAVGLGCGVCRGAVRSNPRSDPFAAGPWRGRYLCSDCWVLYWCEHPEDLADEASRQSMNDEAKQIRFKRGSELLYEDGANRVFLSARGTLILDIYSTVSSKEHSSNEYDPERFQSLVKALQAINGKVPGYQATLSA